jgi:hypothetical protein
MAVEQIQSEVYVAIPMRVARLRVDIIQPAVVRAAHRVAVIAHLVTHVAN